MLRFLVVVSATTFSSYNPDIAKNRVMPQIIQIIASFSLKVESLRDEHPEVRKRLGSFESDVWVESGARVARQNPVRQSGQIYGVFLTKKPPAA